MTPCRGRLRPPPTPATAPCAPNFIAPIAAAISAMSSMMAPVRPACAIARMDALWTSSRKKRPDLSERIARPGRRCRLGFAQGIPFRAFQRLFRRLAQGGNFRLVLLHEGGLVFVEGP